MPRAGAQLSALLLDVVERLHPRSGAESLALLQVAKLTTAQVITLHILRRAPRLSVGAIAERVVLSRPATSHLVDRLVRLRLVARVEDPRDRRQKLVSLSPRGEEMLARVAAAHRRCLDRALHRLSAPTRARLQAALRAVTAELNAEAPS